MHSATTYLFILALMLVIGVVMIWRRRSKHSYVVVAGAVLYASGLMLQAFASPGDLSHNVKWGSPQLVDLGAGWWIGNDLTTAGSLLFLVGLLWYFLSLPEPSSADETP